jgi:flagellar protein FliS
MTYGANALNAYQQNSVYTASREKLLLMLYDGLIRFIKQGIAGLDEGDYQKSNTGLIKAQNIISEFMATLDIKKGGELSKNLNLLYDYMKRRLVEANIKKDKDMAIEVLGYAEELKGAFDQAYIMCKK